MSHKLENALYVFEGSDGVGKSSVVAGVAKWLHGAGVPNQTIAFPGNSLGTLGELIHRVHHNHTLLGISQISPSAVQAMHIASHMDSISTQILPALAQGFVVLLDRFWWSTWVYGLASGVSQGTLENLIAAEKVEWKGILPKIVFLIERKLVPDECLAFNRLYSSLASVECRNYPVEHVLNDASLDLVISKVARTILGEIGGSKDRCAMVAHKTVRRTVSQTGSNNGSRGPEINTSRFSSLLQKASTPVYDAYWRFAAERQNVFYKRVQGDPGPWTRDPVIGTYKFTNAYRASDRTSQYLIQHVIYEGDDSIDELFFRIMLFKLFNKIETWESLKSLLGDISYRACRLDAYGRALASMKARGSRVYSGAYIMPSGAGDSTSSLKHEVHLNLLAKMMQDNVPKRITEMRHMKDVFELLRSYRGLGDFLAFQYTIDINYSPITDFSEMEFVVAGPGALDGIAKCFGDTGGISSRDIIQVVADHQEAEFRRLGLSFHNLWGRPLQLIDCQNLFCEISKYSRIAFPEIRGVADRSHIKQRFRPQGKLPKCWFPPKWGLNDKIQEQRAIDAYDLFR